MEVNTYTFSESAVKKLALKKVLGIQPLILGALIAAFLIANKIENNAFTEDKNLLLISIGIFLLIYIGGLFSAKKSVRQVLEQTSIKITDDSVEYCIPNGENTRLAFKEIKNQKLSKYGLKLYGVNKQVFISNRVTGFNEILESLKTNTQTRLIQYATKYKINQLVLNNLVGLFFMIMVTSLFIVDAKNLKLILGIPIFLVLVYSVITVKADKNIPSEFNFIVKKTAFYGVVLLAYLIYVYFFTV